MKKAILPLLLLIAAFALGLSYPKSPFSKQNKTEKKELDLKTGDLVFQDSESSQSKAIKLATQSKFSHVGVVVLQNGKPYVMEAVEPVRIISFDQWKANGSNGNYTVSRLKNEIKWDETKVENFKKAQLNKHYDLGFYWSDEKMYCSELAFKFYEKVAGISLCEKHQLKEYSTNYPEVRRIMKQRYGENIPWDEWMVSPEDLFRSDKLEIVTH